MLLYTRKIDATSLDSVPIYFKKIYVLSSPRARIGTFKLLLLLFIYAQSEVERLEPLTLRLLTIFMSLLVELCSLWLYLVYLDRTSDVLLIIGASKMFIKKHIKSHLGVWIFNIVLYLFLKSLNSVILLWKIDNLTLIMRQCEDKPLYWRVWSSTFELIFN